MGDRNAATIPWVNEDLRRELKVIIDAADRMADNADAADRVRGRVVERSLAGADAVAAKKFDAAATAAVETMAERISSQDLRTVKTAADEVAAQARSGLASLNVWIDHEDVVASNGVDGSTLNGTDA